MKAKTQFGLIFSINFIVFMVLTSVAQAQTDGTMTFTFTETVPGATKNVLAVWIENNSGAFVKTKMRYWGSGTNDHLPSWVSNSGQNVVDATTGATRTATTSPTAFGVKTVVWDGKNISGTTVANGTYQVFVETAWKSPEPPNGQHSAIISFSFEKSAGATHITPPGNTYFSNITIDWVPTTVSVEKEPLNKFVSVYPNPSDGQVKIQFNKSCPVSRILVENTYGEVVYQKAFNSEISDVKTLDLNQLRNGIYFIEILFSDNTDSFKTKIIISK